MSAKTAQFCKWNRDAKCFFEKHLRLYTQLHIIMNRCKICLAAKAVMPTITDWIFHDNDILSQNESRRTKENAAAPQ